jgi:hypothetical protein
MKRTALVVLAGLLVAFCAVSGVAYAQHGHGPGGGMPGGTPGGMPGMSGTPGTSSTHGDSGMHESDTSAADSSNAANSSPDSVLGRNSKLDSTLTSKFQSQGLLSAGTDLKTACQGFKNLGQCVAALHVSKNLNIPFGCLQADMTGTAPATGTTCPRGTGTSKLSLGKSITTLQPSANATGEAKKANKQANSDLQAAS